MAKIEHHFRQAYEILEQFLGNADNLISIEKAAQQMLQSIQKGGKIISCGNGGSMCDAMHFAEELTGRFRDDRPAIPAIAIADASHITCVANDYGFEYIFSRFVEAHGKKGDVLLAISTSGNSENVINACKSAKEKGMFIVGLTGKDGGKMKTLCGVEIRAPQSSYSDRVQEIHIKVIHALIDYIESNL